jgi:hypothetical protein
VNLQERNVLMNNTKTRSRTVTRSSNDFRVCVKPADLANTLATMVNALGQIVQEVEMTDSETRSIFAAARSARILAREATILSRFDRAVASSDNGSVFTDSDFNYGRWVNG